MRHKQTREIDWNQQLFGWYVYVWSMQHHDTPQFTEESPSIALEGLDLFLSQTAVWWLLRSIGKDLVTDTSCDSVRGGCVEFAGSCLQQGDGSDDSSTAAMSTFGCGHAAAMQNTF